MLRTHLALAAALASCLLACAPRDDTWDSVVRAHDAHTRDQREARARDREARVAQARADDAAARAAEAARVAQVQADADAANAARARAREEDAARAATPEGRAQAAVTAATDAAVQADWGRADDLIRGYKRCMVAADSTAEARKLNAYETTLYREYLERADAKCRAANKCDWAEKVTQTDPRVNTGCYYDSPGL